MATSALGTVLLVSGKEQFLAERAVQNQIQRAKKDSPGLELVELTGGEMAHTEFSQVVGGSLFSPDTLVVIRELADLPKDMHDLLLATVTAMPSNLGLVLVHDGGQRGKGLIRDLKKAKVQQIPAEPIKTYKLPNFVMDEARQLKVRLDSRAAQALVTAVGTDLAALHSAVKQLASDYAGEQLDTEMVNRYFSGRAEVTSFQVADDVLAGKTGDALAKLRWTLTAGTAGPMVTAAFANQLRALGKYLDVRSVGMPRNEIARVVGVPPWKIRSLEDQARRWSPRAVAAAIKEVAKADLAVKGAAADPDFALETMVLGIRRAQTQYNN